MMRAKARSKVRVSLIESTTDVAEIAKLTTKLNYDLVMTTTERQDEPDGTWEMTLATRDERWLQDEIDRLVIVQAVVSNMPVDQVLERVRAHCRSINLLTDRAPSDGPGIGEGEPRP